MNLDSRLAQLGDRLERSIGDELRRTAPAPARRRVPIFAVATAGLAAAGVATILLAGAGSGSGGGRIDIAPVGGAANARETAYVIRHMKARIAATADEGTVMYSYQYASGQVQPDGTLTGLSAPTNPQWSYIAPDTAAFWSNLTTGATIGQAGETGNVVDGRYYSFALAVNHATRTYSLTEGEKPDPGANDGDNTGPGGGYLTDESGPQQVAAALQSGQATEKGTTTVNGTPAIALSVTEPGDPADQSSYEQLWLYVDAQTDQPLRFVNDITGTDEGRYVVGLYVSDWYPSTAANIANAKDRAIPSGYTRDADAAGDGGYPN